MTYRVTYLAMSRASDLWDAVFVQQADSKTLCFVTADFSGVVIQSLG